MHIALRFAALTLLASPLTAQLEPTDLVLSAPGASAIWRADGATLGSGQALATGLSVPHYGWFGPDGNFYVPDRGWVSILKIEPNGTMTALTSGGHLVLPVTCIPTTDGEALVVSDMGAHKILRVGYDGSQTLMHDLASTDNLLNMPDGMAYADDGSLYVANLGDDRVIKIDPSGQATLFSDSELLSAPGGVAIDGAGNLFVANYGTSTILRYRLDTGAVEIFAGPDLDIVHNPNDIKLSRHGGLLTSGRPGKVARIDALGNMTVVFSDPALGELDGVSVPEDATLCSGRYEMYGEGTPGSGGITPQFRAIFSPCAGQLIGLEFVDFVGGAPCTLFVGMGDLAPGVAKIKGATLLVDPAAGPLFLALPLVMPGAGLGAGAGDITLQFQVPVMTGLEGIQLYHQVFAADAGAVKGVSATNGLLETFGL